MNNSKYFKNYECEYFPCHKIHGDFFNCMFCYCPLYNMGNRCGGNFSYTKNGVKDCSECVIVHSKNGYEHIVKKLCEINK